MLMASSCQIIGNVAIKDLSAHVLHSDGDFVYDMGYLLSLNSLKFRVLERRFCVLVVVIMKLQCYSTFEAYILQCYPHNLSENASEITVMLPRE